MDNKYDVLKLENQLCFPLYVCAKEVVRAYKPYLDKLDITYTQYIILIQNTIKPTQQCYIGLIVFLHLFQIIQKAFRRL